MRPEHRLALTVLFCAALISAAIVFRDTVTTGQVVEDLPTEQPELLAMPELDIEQTAMEEVRTGWTFCTGLPIIIDSAILLIGILVLWLLVCALRRDAGTRWHRIPEILLAIALALLMLHYVACRDFLPLQMAMFVALLVIIACMRIIAHLKRGPAPLTATKEPAITPAPPKTPLPITITREPAITPAPPPIKPMPITTAREPKPTKDLNEVLAAIGRSKRTLTELNQTLRRLKKK
jgi:uncharacterized membrane protein SirB2